LFCLFVCFAGCELRTYTLSHSASPLGGRFFRDRVSKTICRGWLRTAILLISASWVAGITGVGHQLTSFVPLWIHLPSPRGSLLKAL
jgi:hypothetical protein